MILSDVGEASVHEFAVSEEVEEGAVTGVSWWSAGLMVAHTTCLLPHDGTIQPTITQSVKSDSQVLQLNNQEHFLTALLDTWLNMIKSYDGG